MQKQELVAKLVSGAGTVVSMAVHPMGDHVILGTTAGRIEWFDLDLSGKPYRVIRSHSSTVESVSFHTTLPLFASASDDGHCHVFHGRVHEDLATPPTIVPVKVLKPPHAIRDALGALACAFHPTQPWLFSAGADGAVRLFVN